jgi:ParB-like chromosome segregation protein Spo0J
MQAATAETMLPVDSECAAEPDLTEAEFASLVASIKATNGPIHQIVVSGDPPAIIAGRHRALACIEAGVPFGTYRVFLGDAAAKSAFITADNDHRRHMSIEQRRDKATARLKANPETSNRQIGLAVGLDDKTVASIRADLEARSEIPNVSTRTDTNNRKQAARKSKKESAKKDTSAKKNKDKDSAKKDISAKQASAGADKDNGDGQARGDGEARAEHSAGADKDTGDDDTIYWTYYPTQFDNVDWQLDHITKDLRETTDLSTIEADDRSKAIERFERIISMARGCIDTLETNDKECLDDPPGPDDTKRDKRIAKLEEKYKKLYAQYTNAMMWRTMEDNLKLKTMSVREARAILGLPPQGSITPEQIDCAGTGWRFSATTR